jgi:CheY-like chemotaxis protein
MSAESSKAPAIIRVMVVDDDPMIRKVVRQMLDMSGYRTTEASDGAEALSRLDSEPVDLIITDVYMPRMDGLQFARALVDRPAPRPRLMAMTGVDGKYANLLEMITLLGAVATLAKPFTKEQLLDAVAAALRGAFPAR